MSKWIDVSPLLYTDWIERDPDALYGLQHVSNSSARMHWKTVIANKLIQNNHENLTTLCTALVSSLFTKAHWIKIDCEVNFPHNNFLCEIKRRGQVKHLHLKRNNISCLPTDIFHGGICMSIQLLDQPVECQYHVYMLSHFFLYKEFLNSWALGDKKRNLIKIYDHSIKGQDASWCATTYSLPHQPLKSWLKSRSRDALVAYSLETSSTFDFSFTCDRNKFFKCELYNECILSSYICDGIVDCRDKSDETNCLDNCYNTNINCTTNCNIKSCGCGSLYFRCLSGDCVPFTLRCNGFTECFDASDELSCLYLDQLIPVDSGLYLINVNHTACPDGYFKCNTSDSTDCYPAHKWCKYEAHDFPNKVQCPYLEHLSYCETYECPSMYKCMKSYCIPLHLVCDGKADCPSEEDEHYFCKDMTCLGMLKCRGDHVCVHPEYLCDGIVHCVESKDDEMLCMDLACPEQCDCRGQTASCTRILLESVLGNDHAGIKGLTVTHAQIPGHITFASMSMLYLVSIQHCNFSSNTLYRTLLKGLHILQLLDLRYNNITYLASGAFTNLQNVAHLDISGNNMHVLNSDSFQGLGHILSLNLTNMNLHRLVYCNFCGLHRILLMNLSHSNLTSINSGAFLGMQFLLEIDLRGNSLVYVDLDVFMSATFSILVNEPYLCCYTERYVKKYWVLLNYFTHARESVSCNNIIGNPAYIIVNGILGLSTVISNIAYFIIQH